jgi:hypothetical protein
MSQVLDSFFVSYIAFSLGKVLTGEWLCDGLSPSMLIVCMLCDLPHRVFSIWLLFYAGQTPASFEEVMNIAVTGD